MICRYSLYVRVLELFHDPGPNPITATMARRPALSIACFSLSPTGTLCRVLVETMFKLAPLLSFKFDSPPLGCPRVSVLTCYRATVTRMHLPMHTPILDCNAHPSRYPWNSGLIQWARGRGGVGSARPDRPCQLSFCWIKSQHVPNPLPVLDYCDV